MISRLKDARPTVASERATRASARGEEASGPGGEVAEEVVASLPPAAVTLRQQVLDELAAGYRPVRAIPYRWPVQRAHVRRVVLQLWREGRLERRPGPGGPDRWLYRVARVAGVTRA